MYRKTAYCRSKTCVFDPAFHTKEHIKFTNLKVQCLGNINIKVNNTYYLLCMVSIQIYLNKCFDTKASFHETSARQPRKVCKETLKLIKALNKQGDNALAHNAMKPKKNQNIQRHQQIALFSLVYVVEVSFPSFRHCLGAVSEEELNKSDTWSRNKFDRQSCS